MFENINSLIDSLALDRRRGAAEIVEDIVELLLNIASTGAEYPDAAGNLFDRAIKQLAHGQPSMAPVLNLLNRACLARDEAGDDWNRLEVSLKGLLQDRNACLEEMLTHLSQLPKAPETLLAYSNSSTVVRVIIACREQGWPKRVICSEARPVNEGLVLARKLTTAGVPTTVFTDAALMSRITEVGAVWVGGDALSIKGLVNKVGSKALAMLARQRKIDFVSLMGTDKLLSPELLPYFGFRAQNPREIAPDDADELDVVNEYYELIPLDLVSHIFTEEGLFQPGELVQRIRQIPVSARFNRLMQS